eukprot:5768510-Lingulodinium_polyedra.AAC.1
MLAFGRLRPPLPWISVAMICNKFAAMGFRGVDHATARSLKGYLRPCCLLSLQVRQFIPPALPGLGWRR